MDERNPEPPRGFRKAAGNAVGVGVTLTKARLELLRLEADEARGTLATVSRFAVVGVVIFTVGYGLLVAALTHLAAEKWLEGSWQIPLCIIAVIHLFVGGVLLIAFRSRMRNARFFDATLDQFDQDRRWLKQLQSDLKSRS